MIYSVSRRTDIPSYYSDWFYNRLEAGFVDVANPFNPKQVSRYSLKKEDVDCFVFWTKNPKKFMIKMDLLKDYNYYFQFTINGYGQDLEPNLPSKRLEVINTFKELSKKIGKEKVIWRYDPVILTNRYSIDKHISYFKYIANELKNYTTKVVFSFVDIYQKNKKHIKEIGAQELTLDKMDMIASEFAKIAKLNNLEISTCAEKIDLDKYGISHNKCIDDKLIYKLFNISVDSKKDAQREFCGCIKCVDIGAYNTCLHGCKYCYANYSFESIKENVKLHNPRSSLIIGEINETTKITNHLIENRNLFNS